MKPKTSKRIKQTPTIVARDKKKPSDYPSIHFRPSQKDKDHIEIKIEKILKILNSRREVGQLLFKKNDVAIEALKKGLEIIEKELI